MEDNHTCSPRRRLTSLWAASVAIAAAAAAFGQADPGQPPSTTPGAAQPEPRDRAQLRRAIEDRLAETRRQEERLQRALNLLDAGESRDRIVDLMAARPDQAAGPADSPRPRSWGDRSRPGVEDGPAPGEGRPQGFGRDGFMLTPEQREHVIAFLTEYLPLMPPRFREAWAKDDEAPNRIAQRMAPRVLEVLNAERRDARLGALKREEFRAGAELIDAMSRAREAYHQRRAEPAAFDAALAELRRRFGLQFDIRARAHHREVEMMAERLEQARADFQAMLADRDRNVQEQVDRFTADLETRSGRPHRGERPPRGEAPAPALPPSRGG